MYCLFKGNTLPKEQFQDPNIYIYIEGTVAPCIELPQEI